jgi:hypothetical protein
MPRQPNWPRFVAEAFVSVIVFLTGLFLMKRFGATQFQQGFGAAILIVVLGARFFRKEERKVGPLMVCKKCDDFDRRLVLARDRSRLKNPSQFSPEEFDLVNQLTEHRATDCPNKSGAHD